MISLQKEPKLIRMRTGREQRGTFLKKLILPTFTVAVRFQSCFSDMFSSALTVTKTSILI